MAPRDYRAAFRAIKAPLLLVAGSKDEVFRANAYADVVKQYSSGRSMLVDGATHVGVLTDTVAIAEIKFLAQSLRASGASAQ
jgi:predicted dienelactone hydrolase